MAAFSRSQQTSAAPDTVWRFWSNPATWPEWNPDVISVTLDGPFAAGAVGTMTTKARTHPIEIVAVDPGKSFQLQAAPVPFTRFLFECAIAEAPNGPTTISQSVTILGPLSGILGSMMGKRVVETFPPILQGLASRAERAEMGTAME